MLSHKAEIWVVSIDSTKFHCFFAFSDSKNVIFIEKTYLKKINGVFGVVCLVGFASLQNSWQTTKASLLGRRVRLYQPYG